MGSGEFERDLVSSAEEIGRRLGAAGAVVVCGGLGGVMAAAARGAKEAGGVAVGILPGEHRRDANDHVDVAIATGMGEMRNMLVVRSADVVIAVGGGFGTLSEIAWALRLGTPVVGLGTWRVAKDGVDTEPIERATSPEDAVERALRHARPR